MKQNKLIAEIPDRLSAEDAEAMERWNALVREILSDDKPKAKRASKSLPKNNSAAKPKPRAGK